MNLLDSLSAFHFLRPLWFLGLPIIVGLWWWYRFRQQQADRISRHFAPHLAKALRTGQSRTAKVSPTDTLAAMLLCLLVGLAGPSWNRMANPMVSQTAPLVIALEVSQGMLASDVPPSRMERAKHKIEDLLATRTGADTALIAYAGSAHLVVPLTNDPELIKPYLEGLRPEIMPSEGDVAAQALIMAEELLQARDVAGTIVFITDGMGAQNAPGFADRQERNALAILQMLPEGKQDATLAAIDAQRVVVSADNSDVAQLEKTLATAYQQALRENDRLAWKDNGGWLAWPAALLALLWFRRGWGLGAVALLLWLAPLGAWLPASAWAQQNSSSVSKRAETTAEPNSPWIRSLWDAFLTPDQQGAWWLQRRDYARASAHFTDPAWQGYALFRDGQYSAAINTLNQLDTADAAYTQGVAMIRNRQYRDAVEAFQTVLQRDPDYPDGEKNLALAQQILEYVEKSREQSDTGEESGEGADDVVFDNEADRGELTQVAGKQGDELLTADQWIQSIDADTSDYLRQRFALEAVEVKP
ncbi:VWA domain-containing protein [Halopseudomonas sabulinigri]|uniref:VWA domain-containing protein n=1 Tax=Halopseudomonas sabulinigri TaxID=472181 RepID=A0ABP9ZQ08_9GAMM